MVKELSNPPLQQDTPRIRVTNSADREVRVYVEPWGFDFPVAPKSWLDFEAEDAASNFSFELSFDGEDRHSKGSESLSVHHMGSCHAIVILLPDGSRKRFGWSIQR